MDVLETREEAAWTGLDSLIGTKRPSDCGCAVSLLVDLRDVAARANRDASFQQQLRSILERHSARPSFLRRVKEVNLEAG